MDRDEVIGVLEKLYIEAQHNEIPEDRLQAITQAIGMIKEVGELREELKNTREASWEIQRQNRELQQELTELKAKYEDLKKAVDSEGLGVKEIEKIISCIPISDKYDAHCFDISAQTIAKAIHEAQTKYKKGKDKK